MKENSQNRKTTRVAVGLFRIEGVNGIYGKVKIKGKTHTTALGTDNPDEARVKRAEWVVRLFKVLKQVTGAAGSLASYVEPYIDSRKREVALGKLKQISLDNLARHFHDLGLHWNEFHTLSVSSYTPDTITQMEQHLLTKAKNLRTKERLSPATYNNFVSAVSLLLDYLKAEGKLTLEHHLALKERIAYAEAPARKVEIPTPEQIKIMRGYLYRVARGRRGECGVKFDFMMLTGARRATANACQVKHINFARRTILLTCLKARAGRPTEKEVPVVDELIEILERFIKAHKLQPADYLFTIKGNDASLLAAAKAAGIPRWFHHACRKWFATRTLISTRDPAAVSDLLCHTNPRTLFEAYRQVCTEHLEGTVRSLKLFPGAAADSSLSAAAARAQQALTKFVRLEKDRAALLLDHLLWIESEVDRGRYDLISKLPGLRQDIPSIPSRTAAPPSRPASPTLLKTNLKYLMKDKGVYHSDVSLETGIPKSTISRACAFGVLQASLLPAFSKYFGVPVDDLLTLDLEHPAQIDTPCEPALSTPEAGTTSPESAAIPMTAPQKSLPEIIQEQAPEALAQTVARNLRSLMLERNLSAPQLSEASGVNYSAIYMYLREQYIPREKSLSKIAQALGVPETEIFDLHRDSIVIDPAKVRGNMAAILAHSYLCSNTYGQRVKVGKAVIEHILATGEISPSQAHKIATKEGISVRQLVSEDLSSKYPKPVGLNPVVVARNIRSVCLEQGLYPAQIAKKAGVTPNSLMDYAQGKIQRIDRHVLTKAAEAVGLSLAEIADPMRPALEITPFFRTNLEYLVRYSGNAAATVSKRCGLHCRIVATLLGGAEPNPVQIVRLAQYFELTPRKLLMEDLSHQSRTSGLDSPGTDRNGSERPEAVQPERILQPVQSTQTTVPKCEQNIPHEGAPSAHGAPHSIGGL